MIPIEALRTAREALAERELGRALRLAEPALAHPLTAEPEVVVEVVEDFIETLGSAIEALSSRDARLEPHSPELVRLMHLSLALHRALEPAYQELLREAEG